MTNRRTHGSGSLRHLGGDRWRYQFRHEGKLLSRVFHARNATEANKHVPEIRQELIAEHELTKDPARVDREERRGWTVRRYSAFYFTEWAPYHLADTTRERYRSIHEHQLMPQIGDLLMSEVTPAHLTAMYERLGKPGARVRGGKVAYSGLTITTVHAVVRALFSFACDVQRDFETNPAQSKAARPRVDRNGRKPKAHDVAAVESFVASVQQHAPHIAVPVLLSAYLGTRRGETLALQWRDVDFDAATITVRRSVSYTKADGLKVKETKTGKLRTIPLDPHTVDELKRIQREQRRARLKFGAGWRGAASAEEDHIAAQEEGDVMRPAVFGAFFRTFCKQRKVAGMSPHVLRHAWVSQMIALGYDAVTIAGMSGHSPDVLLTTYAHAFDARKREAMEALGEARRVARKAAMMHA